MWRRTLRVLSALLVLSAVACANPTAPGSARTRLAAPAAGASLDSFLPIDSTGACRSGYMDPQGRTC